MAHFKLLCPAMALVLLASACAGKSEVAPVDAPRAAPPKKMELAFPRITLSRESTTLGDTVRYLGEHVGGGLVVMNGIQEMAVPALEWRQKAYGDAVQELANATESLVEVQGEYYFLYPAGYEALTRLQLADQLPEAFRNQRISLRLGNGTALYNAFSLLSYHLDRTIVAANLVADARCGEIVLNQVTPAAAIEAILKSARVPAELISIHSTEDYLFIESASAPEKGPFLLAEDRLTDEDLDLLSRSISVVIPLAPAEEEGFVFYPNPIPLADALATLGTQIGVRITALPELEQVPVNPCSFRNLPLRTALDLLLRQWPVTGFGYEVRGDGILIRPL